VWNAVVTDDITLQFSAWSVISPYEFGPCKCACLSLSFVLPEHRSAGFGPAGDGMLKNRQISTASALFHDIIPMAHQICGEWGSPSTLAQQVADQQS